MYLLRGIGVLIAGGLLLVVSMGFAKAQKTHRIATGVWGGQHINIDVGSRSAKVEYDCAHGEIAGPLVIDGVGKFQLRGTFTPEHGGPVRADETQRAQPATYSGEIKGNTMTLTLKVSGSDETETFTLERGKAGELFKCK
jgi:hypothetical protein